MVNIAEILKKCPSGTKLYSPICGECYLYWVVDGVKATGVNVDGEIVVYDNDRSKYSFYKDGTQHSMGECLLFPSKENRDWSTFNNIKRFKKGDFLKDSNGNIFICKEGVLMPLTYIGDSFCVLFNNGDCAIGDWLWKDTVAYYATEEEKQKLIAAIDEKGYIWDDEKLELRKKEPEFKPFDKVLVKDFDDSKWIPALYGFKIEIPSPIHIVTGGGKWKLCIPYEGNEHLLGADENCE